MAKEGTLLEIIPETCVKAQIGPDLSYPFPRTYDMGDLITNNNRYKRLTHAVNYPPNAHHMVVTWEPLVSEKPTSRDEQFLVGALKVHRDGLCQNCPLLGNQCAGIAQAYLTDKNAVIYEPQIKN